MVYSGLINNYEDILNSLFLRVILCFAVSFFLAGIINAQNIRLNENTLIIDEVKDAEIFSVGRSVVIKKEAKGVLVLGGDVIIEGKVEGDAAAVGGSIIQKESGFIGGDVIIIGGKYQYEGREPLRNPGKETVMYAGYEEELRNLMQNPLGIFSPVYDRTFFIQRFVSVIFWFLLGLFAATISPGAIGRAVSGIRISALKIIGIGVSAFITVTLAVVLGFGTLPGYLSAIIAPVVSLFFILAYVYGRITLQVLTGKYLQKLLSGEKRHSETSAVFIGTIVLTVLTALPYINAVAVFFLFSTGIGLVLTSRAKYNSANI